MAKGPQPIEPIDVPPSIEQGLDMVYIDREIAPSIEKRDAQLEQQGYEDFQATDMDMFAPVHPVYTQLRQSLVRYQMRWGDLPQVQIPAGPVLKLNTTGDRVALLRQRLGLSEGTKFDAATAAAVKEFQGVHGVKADGVAGAGTVDALNRGFKHYENVLMLNLERAKRLPITTESGRYVLVDAGAARLWMFENGRPVDSMRVIVGTKETETPMMAALLRFVSVNPYWNTPPDFAQKKVAPHVVAEGLKYLQDRDYQVLSDWSDDATPIDAATVILGVDCDPVAQTGCPPGTKCGSLIEAVGPSVSQTTCVPNGSVAPGGTCTVGEPGPATGPIPKTIPPVPTPRPVASTSRACRSRRDYDGFVPFSRSGSSSDSHTRLRPADLAA